MLQVLGYNFEATYSHDDLGDLAVCAHGKITRGAYGIVVDLDAMNCTAWDEDGKEYPNPYKTGIINNRDWFYDRILEDAIAITEE